MNLNQHKDFVRSLMLVEIKQVGDIPKISFCIYLLFYMIMDEKLICILWLVFYLLENASFLDFF